MRSVMLLEPRKRFDFTSEINFWPSRSFDTITAIHNNHQIILEIIIWNFGADLRHFPSSANFLLLLGTRSRFITQSSNGSRRFHLGYPSWSWSWWKTRKDRWSRSGWSDRTPGRSHKNGIRRWPNANVQEGQKIWFHK
jgi:hypothetical protein